MGETKVEVMSNLETVELKAFVPSKDFELSKRFYQDLGFSMPWSSDDLAYLHHGNCSFLSDQGSEYAAKEYRATLEATGMRVSMSRKGHCWDNAHMESCFGSLKTEMVYFQKFQQLDEAVAYITDYIRFYNCERLHFSLGYRSPSQFEATMA
jgi:putative transposase